MHLNAKSVLLLAANILVESDNENQQQDIWTVDPFLLEREGAPTLTGALSLFKKKVRELLQEGDDWTKKITNLTEKEGGVSEAALQAAPSCPCVPLKHHSEVHTGEMRQSTRNSNMDALFKNSPGLNDTAV